MVGGDTRPTFDDQSVFVKNYPHTVAALNKTDGALRWTRQLTVSRPDRGGYGANLAGGRLVIGDIDLFGLDRATGAVVWTYAPSTGEWPGFQRQTTDGITVYCGSKTGHVFAVDGATGAERWVTRVAVSGDADVPVYDPVLVAGVVYVGFTIHNSLFGTGGAAAIDAQTGALRWVRILPEVSPGIPSGGFSAVVVVGTLVVAAAGDGTVYGLDKGTGEIRYTIPKTTFVVTSAQLVQREIRPLLAVGDAVYVGSSAGFVTALAGSDLRRLWIMTLSRGTPVDISADEKYIYSAYGGGQFGAMRPSDGKTVFLIERGTFRADDDEAIEVGPGMDGVRLYLGGGHEFYALPRP